MLLKTRGGQQSEGQGGHDGGAICTCGGGAHPDDIELGCGGALAKHVAAGDQVAMLVVTRGEVGPPGDTAQRVHEQHRAVQVLGVDTLMWG